MAKLIRTLAWAAAICLVGATLLRLGDQYNVFATPPTLSDTANLVDRLLASLPYRQAIWPVYLGWNLLFAIALLLVIPLSSLLVRAVGGSDPRVRAAGATLAAGGIIGAVGQLLITGAVAATISEPYCDCGFKETELVSQAWAQNLIQGASDWLSAAALVLVGIALVLLGPALGRRARSGFGPLTLLAGILTIVGAGLSLTGLLEPLPDLLAVATFGVALPVWAWWLGRDAGLIAADASGMAGG